MDTTLAYLRESLSNHLNHASGKAIYKKLLEHRNESEERFVQSLDEVEVVFLNKIIKDEIRYAKDEQDTTRVKQLNEVYELLI